MGEVRLRVPYRHARLASTRTTLPLYRGNLQLGCGLAVRLIKGHRYVYFWSYEPGPLGSRRLWKYVGPVNRSTTRAKATDLLTVYHLKVRREVDRRIQRLLLTRP